jgi:acid phosphatase
MRRSIRRGHARPTGPLRQSSRRPTIGERVQKRDQVSHVALAQHRRSTHRASKGRFVLHIFQVLRTVIYTPSTPRGSPDFQAHHHPFNYYAGFDPVTHAAARAAHLKDYNDLVADAAAGNLPSVAFYKPQGNLNQHEGYANLDDGDAHIADLVAKLQASPQWSHMVIVITYDEFGGAWDHAAPPKGDLLGPGTRIPAIVISPFAKRHYVDHTVYDTASILRLIARRYDLPKLPGIVRRDVALVAHGGRPMGDLTEALDLRRRWY